MPDILWAALAQPGLGWLLVVSALAGVVYGFAGFGAALVFMPLATVFLEPILAVAAFAVSAFASLFTVLPEAWQKADRRAALTMLFASILMTPFGLLVLRYADETVIRWAVSTVVLLTLALLISGVRYRRTPGPKAWWPVGAGVGFVGASTGLNGPVLVLFQLGGTGDVARMRANTVVTLTLNSLALLPVMALQGFLPAEAVGLGLLLLVPYGLGGLLGRRLFDPSRVGLYRTTAYAIIAAAAVVGLPIFL